MAKDDDRKSKKKRSIWDILSTASVASIALMVFLLAVMIVGIGQGASSIGITGMMTADDASNKALTLIKENLVQPGTDVSIINIEEESGIYKLTLMIDGKEFDSYMSKDGKYFFPQGMDINEILTKEVNKEVQNQQQTPQTPKTDTPKAEAFVMSHCPYGLQFMKAFVPVMDLLKDKADLKIGFVDYIMHGVDEFNDNNRIYCIQKDAPTKLTEYLRCFVQQKDYETCLQEAGIDKATIDTCIKNIDEEYNLTNIFEASEDRFPKYPLEADLNEQYGVRGSPTFVINGQVISVSRSAEAIKEAICSAFNNPPKECDTQLSTSAESPGFGAIGNGQGADSSGSC